MAKAAIDNKKTIFTTKMKSNSKEETSELLNLDYRFELC